MILATNLHKTFPPEILTNVSLHIQKGQSIAITGRSGEGKTTLLHILSTLEPYDQGSLLINNQPVTPSNAAILRNKHIGFIFQSFNLLEDFSALDNVLMPARISRRPISRQKGLDLLHSVSLSHRADFLAKHLSGGERQRVAIARALCNDPDIIFADEPTGNLDATNSKVITDLLFDLTATHRKTLILVTHNPTLAARCQRHFILAEGHLIEQDM